MAWVLTLNKGKVLEFNCICVKIPVMGSVALAFCVFKKLLCVLRERWCAHGINNELMLYAKHGLWPV